MPSLEGVLHGHDDGSMSMTDGSMSSNPLILGTICGLLHTVGPDHLATLIAFSALMNPWAAAKVGVAWGAGHCAGIIFIGFLVVCLSRLLPGMHMSSWEHYGDYIIGLSMIVVSMYFMSRESEYVETRSDGSIVVKRCACHGDEERSFEHSHAPTYSPKSSKKKELFCNKFGAESAPSESSPLLAQDQQFSTDGKGMQGAIVGLVQGMCCPMGLVSMGVSAGKSPLEILIITLTTIAVSILGTASLAAGWACISSSSWMAGVNPKFIYRASCLVGLLLGVIWILANYFGVLDKLNFTESHH